MTCKPVIVGATRIDAHLIEGHNYVQMRALAEACGGLVLYDAKTGTAEVVPPLAPAWDSFSLLMEADRRWRPEFQMHQARFDYIWQASLRKKVDPRLMIAVLLQEGTGSFDTNPDNAGEYNGNGPDADWIRDTDRALSHVAGKLAWYDRACTAGFLTEAQKLGLQGTCIQFINWPGPIANHQPMWGCYAQHADWWAGVEDFYADLGGNVGALSDFWRGSGGPAGNIRCEAVTNRPDLCSDLSGKQGRPGVVTWLA